MAQFTMPSLGADMESGTLVEWLVRPGDQVHRGDPMAVVDTDKSAVEIESFDDGVVDAFLVEPGQRVAVGTPLATIAPATDGTAPAAAPVKVHSSSATAPPGRRRISPYARRLAHELSVDLDRVVGTGSGGLVRAPDVRAAAAAAGTAEVGPAPVVPVHREPAEPVPTTSATPAPVAADKADRGTIAALMTRAKREIPHYYVATTVDLFPLVDWLTRTNRDRSISDRIIPAAGLLKAAALAAREVPEVNGFWQDGRFVAGDDVHLGVAIAVRNGALVAPAIHGAADLDLPTLMLRLRDLVARARGGHLRRAELTDPTLTVTDLGDQGVDEVIGVIYPPQVALVGIGRVAERPWAVDGLLGVRPVTRLTLSGDHRATDGATGARYLVTMERLLQQPERL